MNWADEVEDDGTYVPNDEDAEALKVAAKLEQERREKEKSQPPPAQPVPPPAPAAPAAPVQNAWAPAPQVADPAPPAPILGAGPGGSGNGGGGGGAASDRWKNHMKRHDEAMAQKRQHDRVVLQAKLVAHATSDLPGGDDWRGAPAPARVPSAAPAAAPAMVQSSIQATGGLRAAAAAAAVSTPNVAAPVDPTPTSTGSWRSAPPPSKPPAPRETVAKNIAPPVSAAPSEGTWERRGPTAAAPSTTSAAATKESASTSEAPGDSSKAVANASASVKEDASGKTAVEENNDNKDSSGDTKSTKKQQTAKEGSGPGQSKDRAAPKPRVGGPNAPPPPQLQRGNPPPGRGGPRRSHDGHAQNQQQQQSRPLSYGIIAALKERFGFIKMLSAQQESDVFFHYDEAAKFGFDPSKASIGDEVEFELMAGRSGKPNATRVKVLEKGGIPYDKVVEGKTGLFGVVITETTRPQQTQNRRQGSFYNRGAPNGLHGNSAFDNDFMEAQGNPRYYSGRIMVLSEEEVENLREIVPGNVSAAAPDNDKVYSFAARGMKKAASAQASSASTNAGDKSEGADKGDDASSTTSSRASSRHRQPRRSHIQLPVRGDIVRFDVAEELGSERIHAVNITVMQSARQRVQKIIDAEASKPGVKRQRGRVSALSTASKWTLYAQGSIEAEDDEEPIMFLYRDLPEKFHPKGRSAAEKAAKDKEKRFGASDWRQDAELAALTRDSTLRVGTELEFTVVSDPFDPERKLAVKMEALAAGTIKLEDLIKEKATAELVSLQRKKVEPSDTASQHSAGSSQRRGSSNHEPRPLVGKLRILDDIADLPDDQREVTFSTEHMLTNGPRILPGDKISADIWRVKRSGNLRAQNIQLVLPSEEEERIKNGAMAAFEGKCKRETGIVANLRAQSGFGFIECLDRPGQVFFPIKEVIGDRSQSDNSSVADAQSVDTSHGSRRGGAGSATRNDLIQEGQPVSFEYIVEPQPGGGDKRSVAVRVLKLDKVEREIVLQEEVEGIVTKVPHRASNRSNFPSRGRGGNNNSNTGREEFGTLQCVPAGLVAPHLYEVLSNLAAGELYIGEGEGRVQATAVEVIADNPLASKSKRSKGHSRRSSNKSSAQAKSAAAAAASKTFSLQISQNEERILRDYCHWLGLFCDYKSMHNDKSSTEPRITLVRKKAAKKPNGGKNKKDSEEAGESVEDDEKLSPAEDVHMTVSFSVSSIVDKRQPKVGDKVKFRLCLDKRYIRHVAQEVHVLERSKQEVTQRPRRQHAETGIVACLHDQGFGFVQSVDRPERLFFHIGECEDDEFRTRIEPGDEVEYIYQHAPRGGKATKIRPLPKGSIVIDEPIIDAESGEQRIYKGVIVAEPKSKADPRFGQRGQQNNNNNNANTRPSDHPKALRVASIHVPFAMMGRVLDASAASDPKSLVEKTNDNLDWRRSNELSKMHKTFADDDAQLKWVAKDLPKQELEELESLAQRDRFATAWIGETLLIAKSKEELQILRAEKEKETGSATEEDKTPSPQEKEKTESAEDKKHDESGDDSSSKDEKDTENEEEDEDESGDIEDSPVVARSAKGKANRKKSANDEDAPQSAKYVFTLSDVIQPKESDDDPKAVSNEEEQGEARKSVRVDVDWMPTIGDEVEFVLCKNRATGKVRATNMKLISAGTKTSRGLIEGTVSGRFGFVRPLVAGESSDGKDNVDESYKPGLGGRDGTIRFDRSEIRDGVELNDGDEVEYTLVVNSKTKEARATRVRLIKKAPEVAVASNAQPRLVNRDALRKLGTATSAVAVQRFSMAKGPDGTSGFPAGRGRNLPERTKLRVTAQEFKPSETN